MMMTMMMMMGQTDGRTDGHRTVTQTLLCPCSVSVSCRSAEALRAGAAEPARATGGDRADAVPAAGRPSAARGLSVAFTLLYFTTKW